MRGGPVGFLPEETIYKLMFDGDLQGLEVRARTIPMGTLTLMTTLADRVGSIEPGKLTADQMGAVNELLQGFDDALVDWNLERRDKAGAAVAVPATIEGMRTQDPVLMMTIVKGWFDAVAGVAAPLEPGSTSGGSTPVTGRSFPESGLPMEPLSLSSLPTPA